jgi:hypothetical protein
MHARTPGGFTDRLSVVAVIFGSFDVGFDILRRDEVHRVAERNQFAGPVMRAAAGFQGDFSRRKFLEERDHLSAAEIGSQNWPVLLIDPV